MATLADHLDDIFEIQNKLVDLVIWICDVLEEMREPEHEAKPQERPGEPPHRRDGAAGAKAKPKPPTMH